MCKVSVVVPIYNAENYLEKCIDSILNQTLEDIELILVNDGSIDKSLQIIEQYAKKDDRVRIINQKNSGPAVGRNSGISLAKGRYIGFVDSDDYIEPTMYEELYNIANSENIQVAMCSYIEKHLHNKTSIIVKAKLESSKLYKGSEIEKDIISTFSRNENYGFYSLCNKIYLREWLLDSKIIMDENRDHGEDWWFNINVFSKLNSFIYIDKEMYNYIHINENSLMLKYRENQFDLFLDGRLKIKEVIPKEYMDEREFNKRFVYEFSSYIIRTMKEIGNKQNKKFLINRVLNNSEVLEACSNVKDIGIHYKIILFFIRNKLNILSTISYRIISIIK